MFNSLIHWNWYVGVVRTRLFANAGGAWQRAMPGSTKKFLIHFENQANLQSQLSGFKPIALYSYEQF